MTWTWCSDLAGWAAHAGAYRPGRRYPVDGSNDPDLGSVVPDDGEIDVMSAAPGADPCSLAFYDEPHVAYFDAAGENWQPIPLSAGGSVPADTDLYVLVSGPNYDITDPEPDWDPADALSWLHDPPPGPPTFAGIDGVNFQVTPSGHVPTHHLAFDDMPVPPFPGDIVFGFAYQFLENADLAVSDGWTVDHQHADTDGSWIVFHRAISGDDEPGPTISGISGAGFYAGYVWTYRDFYGFAAPVDVAYSTDPVVDLDSPAVTTSEDESLVTAAWVVPITTSYPSDWRVYIPAGTFPTFTERYPGPGSGAPIRIYDNKSAEGAPGTYGSITAHRHDIFDPDVDLPSPYFCVMCALLPEAPTGGWGIGMVRMGN